MSHIRKIPYHTCNVSTHAHHSTSVFTCAIPPFNNTAAVLDPKLVAFGRDVATLYFCRKDHWYVTVYKNVITSIMTTMFLGVRAGQFNLVYTKSQLPDFILTQSREKRTCL